MSFWGSEEWSTPSSCLHPGPSPSSILQADGGLRGRGAAFAPLPPPRASLQAPFLAPPYTLRCLVILWGTPEQGLPPSGHGTGSPDSVCALSYSPAPETRRMFSDGHHCTVSLQDYNACFLLLLLFFWWGGRYRVKCRDWKRPQTGVEPHHCSGIVES